MHWIAIVVSVGLVCVVAGCNESGDVVPSGAGEAGEGGESGDDDAEAEEDSGEEPSCLVDDEGECVECRPDVLESCADGLTCVDWACADLCAGIGGMWAGTRIDDAIESPRPLELELLQVDDGSTSMYNCPADGFYEPPPDAVGIAGTLGVGEVSGWFAPAGDGTGRICFTVGEGHNASFFSGTTLAGCTTMSGAIAAYASGGRFAVARVL